MALVIYPVQYRDFSYPPCSNRVVSRGNNSSVGESWLCDATFAGHSVQVLRVCRDMLFEKLLELPSLLSLQLSCF